MEEWSIELREKMVRASHFSVKLCRALHLLLHSKKVWEDRKRRFALNRLKDANMEARTLNSRTNTYGTLVKYARSKSLRILKRDVFLKWTNVVSGLLRFP